MKTVKNRKRKFALGMKIAALCSCLALASVGFASWLVVHEPEDQTVDGAVNVALTSSAELKEIKATPTLGADDADYKAEFVFGRPTKGEAAPIKWLVPEDVEVEDLVEEYTLTFKPQNLPTEAKAVFAFDFDGIVDSVENNTALTTLIQKGYVTLTITIGDAEGSLGTQVTKTFNTTTPFPLVDDLETPAVDESVLTFVVPWEKLSTLQEAGDTASIPFKIEFEWGGTFGGENPYNFYNTLVDPDADAKAGALNVLGEIASLVKGITLDQATGKTEVTGAKDYSYLISIDASIDLGGLEYPD